MGNSEPAAAQQTDRAPGESSGHESGLTLRRSRPSSQRYIAVMALALVCVSVFSALSGAYTIDVSTVWRIVTGNSVAEHALDRSIFLELRLPRIVLGMVAGAGLALAGAVMQALFRNPLADPGLIGISSGAALGAVTAIVFGGGAFMVLAPAAFVGSLLAAWCAYLLGMRQQGMAGLLLAGIAINAVCASVIGLFSFVADDSQLRSLTFWTLGSLAQGGWSVLAVLFPWALVLSIVLCRQWRALNALLLGEREATHLGFDLIRMRRQLVLGVALLVGPLVAATGIIGFIGLVVPHMLRMVMGANHRALLPASLLGGAIALVLADALARLVLVPAELPVGIVTSLIGAPFFLWLLVKSSHGSGAQ